MKVFLEPADQATADALAAFREAATKRTGVRDTNHDAYAFHITLGYLIKDWSPKDAAAFEAWRVGAEARLKRETGVIELPLAKLVEFQSMGAFTPVED
jgi:hypothetical protein